MGREEKIMDINKNEENLNTNIEVDSENGLNEVANEQTIEKVNEAGDEIIEDNSANKKGSKISFAETFLSAAVDIIATGLISAALLFIVDAILRVAAGYYIKEIIPMFLIAYLVVALLYTSIMESSKNGDTIGKRVAKLKVIRAE